MLGTWVGSSVGVCVEGSVVGTPVGFSVVGVCVVGGLSREVLGTPWVVRELLEGATEPEV